MFCGLLWWAAFGLDSPSLMVATLICLVTSQVISYIKARAEATGLDGGGGLIERPERLVIVLAGAGFSGALRGSDAVPRGDVAAGGRQPGDRRSAPALGAQFAGRDRQDHPARRRRVSELSENLSDWGYAAGWRLVRTMPEPMARSVFRTGALRRPRWGAGSTAQEPGPGDRHHARSGAPFADAGVAGVLCPVLA